MSYQISAVTMFFAVSLDNGLLVSANIQLTGGMMNGADVSTPVLNMLRNKISMQMGGKPTDIRLISYDQYMALQRQPPHPAE